MCAFLKAAFYMFHCRYFGKLLCTEFAKQATHRERFESHSYENFTYKNTEGASNKSGW